MSPRISVVIPAFNAEKYLREAIDSVLRQTLPADEVIVVNDGSSDGTGGIGRSFGGIVHVIDRPNGGIGAARNTAMESARGEYLSFLDADDVWPPERLALLMASLERDPALDASFGGVVEFGAEMEDTEPKVGQLASSMLIRRASFDRVGPFREDIRIGEFIDWYARAREQGLNFTSIPDVVLRRRIHETNTGRLQRDARPDYVRVLRAALHRRREAGE